jgi:hypothetical protein
MVRFPRHFLIPYWVCSLDLSESILIACTYSALTLSVVDPDFPHTVALTGTLHAHYPRFGRQSANTVFQTIKQQSLPAVTGPSTGCEQNTRKTNITCYVHIDGKVYIQKHYILKKIEDMTETGGHTHFG